MEEEKEELLKRPKHPVVFINHVDTYVGKNISKVVASSIVGANLDATDNESQTSAQAGETKENFYRVVGTLLDPVKNQKPAWVEEIFEYSKKEELLKHILQSDIIIYDIISRPDQVDEATWVVSALHAEIENFASPKIFICLSSIMTWARTKPLDPDEPEIPFTEDDYRRRRAHPNFRPHISTEKLVIKLGKTSKTKLLTYVIASGLMYGESEEIFHSLFKSAWHCQYPLQCYGNGQNIVPMIHITDLSNVLVNVCDSQPKVRYLIAKDDSQSPLEEIVKCVSTHLGTGEVKHVTKEQALLIKDLQQTDFDMLLVNLRMDAGYIREGMNIAWKAETGLIDNIESVIQEYKKTRGLQPIRACVLGAPSTGKTLVVKQLCQLYKLHHIAIQDVINEAIGQLEQSAARADADGDDEDDVKAEEDRELMEALNENKEQNNGRYNDNYIIRFYKNKLHSMPCQNQGFILDGYPKTYEVARELFAADDVDDEDEGGSVLQYSKLIMPDVVVSLDATDDFLKARVMNLPESVVAGTHNTEEGFLRRLAEFRAVNTEDETVLNYFDELEIHPDHIDVSQDSSPEMSQTVERIKKLLGEPRNYGPTAEELIEIQRIDAERKLERERKDKEDRIRKEAEEATERTRKEEEWRIRLNEVKKEEEEVLETQSIPLRNYLMKHVMPTLSQGLVECTKVRPDDPVDFLAEYLFKNNPQID